MLGWAKPKRPSAAGECVFVFVLAAAFFLSWGPGPNANANDFLPKHPFYQVCVCKQLSPMHLYIFHFPISAPPHSFGWWRPLLFGCDKQRQNTGRRADGVR
jgi:hypothetical protein